MEVGYKVVLFPGRMVLIHITDLVHVLPRRTLEALLAVVRLPHLRKKERKKERKGD